ncbi:hypothetical protein phiOC_p260 [Ochrobactrum phage vB_OspM_OC]|nr:hypothetical protein phiOC_p260 [Ochrobactrum phage vB_OspM_OC]
MLKPFYELKPYHKIIIIVKSNHKYSYKLISKGSYNERHTISTI